MVTGIQNRETVLQLAKDEPIPSQQVSMAGYGENFTLTILSLNHVKALRKRCR